MTKRLITLMAALLVLGFVATGCGDDDTSGDNGDTAVQTVTDTVTETVPDEADTDADNGGAAVPESLEQAVEQCKDGIDKAPQLSDDTKDSLQEICEKAGSGNAEDAKDAIAEVCKKNAASLPEGSPGRELALAACDQAGQ